jgi:hypothetical protein
MIGKRTVILVLAAAMVLPASAAASDVVTNGTLSYSTQTAEMPTTSNSSLEGVGCPGGGRPGDPYPISSGFETDFDPGQDTIHIAFSGPFGVSGITAWGWAYNFDVASTRHITFRTVCAEEQPRYVQVLSKSGGAGGGTAFVKCPRKRHVYGGGGESLGSSFPFDSNDRGKKPDDGWAVRDVGHATPAMVAVCGKTMPDYNHHTVTVTPASGTTSTQGCGDTPVAIGGGYRIGGGGGFLTQSIVSNPDTFNEFSATVENDTPQDLKFTVYSICGDPSEFG